MLHNGHPYEAERGPFAMPPDTLSWPHLERNLSMERRVTILEISQQRHHERLTIIEADAAAVRAAMWRLLRGAVALMLGLALDQGLNAGALLMVVKKSLGH